MDDNELFLWIFAVGWVANVMVALIFGYIWIKRRRRNGEGE